MLNFLSCNLFLRIRKKDKQKLSIDEKDLKNNLFDP